MIDVFDPDMLEALIAVAETRSFTEAARRMGRSQSTVSATIRRLEEQAGCRLVSRTTRVVLLTTDGEEMVRYACHVNELTRQTRGRLSCSRGAAPVRLGIFLNFNSPALTTALVEFGRLHPGVQVTIVTERNDILLGRLRDDALDIVLGTCQPGHGFGLPVWQDELVWAGRCPVPTSLRDPVPLAVRIQPSILRRIATDTLNAAGRPHVVAFEGDTLQSVAAAVDAGMGFGVVTRTIRPPHIPIVDRPYLLPPLGGIDFFLLVNPSVARPEVTSLFDILRALAPEMFQTAASTMFGGPPASTVVATPDVLIVEPNKHACHPDDLGIAGTAMIVRTEPAFERSGPLQSSSR